MKRTILMAVALLTASPTWAAVGCIGSDRPECTWILGDYILELGAVGSLAVDGLTTRDIVLHRSILYRQKVCSGDVCYGVPVIGSPFSEVNPLLGAQPSIAWVNTYFVLALTTQVLVADLLPRPWRTVWQAVTITLETGVSIRNIHMGVTLRF